jgi:hypothetical protein
MTESTERCGFLIQRADFVLPGHAGAVRVSKDGLSNFISCRFFDDINADTDEAFVAFMSTAIRPDFPHPFMVDDLMDADDA